MNSQKKGIYDLLSELEVALDKGFPLLSNYLVVVKRDVVDGLIDRIYASLPMEVQEARALLRRKDELQYEAQQRAEKILQEAKTEADRLVSKSDVLLKVQREAEDFKEQVISYCTDIKRKAVDEAEGIRLQAKSDAERMQDGASVYAEQILTNLEQNLNQLQQIVKNGQVSLEQSRVEHTESLNNAYSTSSVQQEEQKEYASATSFTID